jgi:hypothetical protein
LQSQGVVWLVRDGQILELWEPEIIYIDDDFIAAKGLDRETEVVTSRIAGATDGMKIATIKSQDTESTE